jgi:hypothetical protein
LQRHYKTKAAELNFKISILLDASESIARTGSWKFDAITMGLTWSKVIIKNYRY